VTQPLAAMFVFFSNKIGWLGSIAISLIGTAVLFFIMRGCAGAHT
jgi:hypothetical protein